MSAWTKEMDLQVAAQLQKHFDKKPSAQAPFVTITREFGCDGVKLANAVVKKMNKNQNQEKWALVTREMMLEASNKKQFTKETLELLERFGHSDLQSYIREAIFGMGNQIKTVQTMAKIIRVFAERGHVVFLGGGAPIITEDLAKGVHILYYGSLEWRIKNHAKRWGINEMDARQKVVHGHGERESFVKTFLNRELSDPSLYHFAVNNEHVNVDHASDLIVTSLKALT
jgi:hypothetical protein